MVRRADETEPDEDVDFIKANMSNAELLESKALKHWRAAGERLTRKKDELGHGRWLAWLTENGIDQQRENECRRLYRGWGKLPPGGTFGLKEALRIIADAEAAERFARLRKYARLIDVPGLAEAVLRHRNDRTTYRDENDQPIYLFEPPVWNPVAKPSLFDDDLPLPEWFKAKPTPAEPVTPVVPPDAGELPDTGDDASENLDADKELAKDRTKHTQTFHLRLNVEKFDRFNEMAVFLAKKFGSTTHDEIYQSVEEQYQKATGSERKVSDEA